MEKSNKRALSRGFPRRQAGRVDQTGRVSKVLVTLGVVFATLAATQATALAGNEIVEVTVKCTESNSIYWVLSTNDEERVHTAIEKCAKAGGIAVVSAA